MSSSYAHKIGGTVWKAATDDGLRYVRSLRRDVEELVARLGDEPDPDILQVIVRIATQLGDVQDQLMKLQEIGIAAKEERTGKE